MNSKQLQNKENLLKKNMILNLQMGKYDKQISTIHEFQNHPC